MSQVADMVVVGVVGVEGVGEAVVWILLTLLSRLWMLLGKK